MPLLRNRGAERRVYENRAYEEMCIRDRDYNDTLVQYMQEYRAHCISIDDILEETR